MTDFSGNPELDEIIFGNLLGDGYLILGKGYLNAKFGFQQSTIHTEYFMAVFTIFKNLNLCSTNYGPYFYLDNRTNKTYSFFQFKTYSIPYFTKLYNLWYINNIKVIPFEFIHLLTPLALAHWIMGDATFKKDGGLTLCTANFAKEEVQKLADYLTTNYNLTCSIHTEKKAKSNKTYYNIYVWKRSLPLLRALVLPYLVPSMFYKVGL